MFPCNFISYLRLHYSMKENLDTFQEVVKVSEDQQGPVQTDTLSPLSRLPSLSACWDVL